MSPRAPEVPDAPGMAQVHTPVLPPKELEAAREVEEAKRATERAEANAKKEDVAKAAEAEAVAAGEEKHWGCVQREQRVLDRERTCEDDTVRSIMYSWTLVAMGHETMLHIRRTISVQFEIGAEH